MKKYFEGLKYGLLLQIAVGPMCFMVFNTAKNSGFLVALTLVLAITLVDALYIVLASVGASKLFNSKKVQSIVKIIGAIVLFLFGLNIILGVFGITFIKGLNLNPNSQNAFIQGIVLTLSNPITIIFWTSVLTTKLIEEKFTKNELIKFSFGLVSATILFMTLVAVLGTILSSFISNEVSNVLNVLVGIIIMLFGIKILVKREN